MKKFNNDLIIQILEHLGEVYPRRIFHEDDILPDYKDRGEIKRYVAYCKGDGKIECEEDWMLDGSLYIKNIRITNKGIDYLLKRSK
jgi:hypothetical protein